MRNGVSNNTFEGSNQTYSHTWSWIRACKNNIENVYFQLQKPEKLPKSGLFLSRKICSIYGRDPNSGHRNCNTLYTVNNRFTKLQICTNGLSILEIKCWHRCSHHYLFILNETSCQNLSQVCKHTVCPK